MMGNIQIWIRDKTERVRTVTGEKILQDPPSPNKPTTNQPTNQPTINQ